MMRDTIRVYDAQCCRVWPMPVETFNAPPGHCGYCGQVPEPIGNSRTLRIHQPWQYELPTFREHHV